MKWPRETGRKYKRLSLLPAAVLTTIAMLLGSYARAQGGKDCQTISKQIDDLADKVAEVSTRMGRVEEWIDHPRGSQETTEKNKQTLEKDKSTLRKNKLTIAKLVESLCACCGKKSGSTETAQSPGTECEALMKQIDELVDKVAEVSARMGRVEEWVDHPRGSQETTEKNKQTLEKDRSTLRKNNLTIAKLVEKVCGCCATESGTAQQPTPSTTDKVTDALKTIGSSISIGIGGGASSSHHDRHDRVLGEDRTKTAEKLSDHKTHATKTPPTTGKTVTSACKCHPCTCSPCHCH